MTDANDGIGTKRLALLALAVVLVAALLAANLRGGEPALEPPF